MIRFDTKKDMEHYDNLYKQIIDKDKEIERLNNIIDKAIEHLKESIDDYLKDDKDLDGTCNVICVETIKKRYLKPVLDILRGEDNE